MFYFNVLSLRLTWGNEANDSAGISTCSKRNYRVIGSRTSIITNSAILRLTETSEMLGSNPIQGTRVHRIQNLKSDAGPSSKGKYVD